MSNNKKDAEQVTNLQDIQIARLSFIGATIATLGDGLSAIAAGLALNALENPDGASTQSMDAQFMQSQDVQKQIDYLIHELKQIKRMMK